MIYDEAHYNQLLAVCKCYKQDAEYYEKKYRDLQQENQQLKAQNEELKAEKDKPIKITIKAMQDIINEAVEKIVKNFNIIE